MWNIKHEVTNKLTELANTSSQIQTPEWCLPEEKVGGRVGELGKGSQVCGNGKKLDFGWWTCKNIQILKYNIVLLKFMSLTNVASINVIKNKIVHWGLWVREQLRIYKKQNRLYELIVITAK